MSRPAPDPRPMPVSYLLTVLGTFAAVAAFAVLWLGLLSTF